LSLHFYEVSTIFYAFYKIKHLHPRSRRNKFTNRSSEFANRPSRRKLRLQLGRWRHGRRRELDSGKGNARLGRERAGNGVGSPRVPFRGLLVAEEQPASVLSDAGRRWPQGASAPERSWRGQVNAWHGRLQMTLGWHLGGLGDIGGEWRGSLATMTCQAGRRRFSVAAVHCSCEGNVPPFK
jgi:hypothetical protein